jgi:hypothetical protein
MMARRLLFATVSYLLPLGWCHPDARPTGLPQLDTEALARAARSTCTAPPGHSSPISSPILRIGLRPDGGVRVYRGRIAVQSRSVRRAHRRRGATDGVAADHERCREVRISGGTHAVVTRGKKLKNYRQEKGSQENLMATQGELQPQRVRLGTTQFDSWRSNSASTCSTVPSNAGGSNGFSQCQSSKGRHFTPLERR